MTWTVEGALLVRVPPRGRLGQRDVRGKAGRSRPHLGWGFRVMEVREIVVGKDMVEEKGGREVQCKSERPTAQAGGGALLILPHLPPPPVEALCFCFIVLKWSTLVVLSCRCGDTYSFLVSAREDSKEKRPLARTHLAQGLVPLQASVRRGLGNFVDS